MDPGADRKKAAVGESPLVCGGLERRFRPGETWKLLGIYTADMTGRKFYGIMNPIFANPRGFYETDCQRPAAEAAGNSRWGD